MTSFPSRHRFRPQIEWLGTIRPSLAAAIARQDRIGIDMFQPNDGKNQDTDREYTNTVKDKAHRATQIDEVIRSESGKNTCQEADWRVVSGQKQLCDQAFTRRIRSSRQACQRPRPRSPQATI